MADLTRIHPLPGTRIVGAQQLVVPSGASLGDVLGVVDDGSGGLASDFIPPGAVSPIVRIPLIAPLPGSTFAMPNMAAALVELDRVPADLRRCKQARIVGNVKVAGAAGAKLTVQWSPDEVVAFDYLNAAGGPVLSLAAVARVRGAWVGLVDGAQADVFLRTCSIGGDAVADPETGMVFLELSGEPFTTPFLILSALTHRFAADLIVGLSDGDPVATWDDESGNNSDATQANAGERGTYETNVLNGKPVVRLPAGKSLSYPRTISDDFSIYVVFNGTGGTGVGENFYDGAALVQGEVGGVTDDFGISINANGKVLAGTGNPDRTIVSAAGYNDGNTHVAVFTRKRSTGTLGLWIDRALIGTRSDGGTQALTAPTNLLIKPEGFDIGEIDEYSAQHGTTSRENMEDYLFDRWVP